MFLKILLIVASFGFLKSDGISEENKYIDLLPEDEKKAFLEKIAKRILEEIQTTETKNKSGEISEDQLNAHSEYVANLLREESMNLRRINDNKKAFESTQEEVKKENDGNLDRIDLTLRTNDKNGTDTSDIPGTVHKQGVDDKNNQEIKPDKAVINENSKDKIDNVNTSSTPRTTNDTEKSEDKAVSGTHNSESNITKIESEVEHGSSVKYEDLQVKKKLNFTEAKKKVQSDKVFSRRKNRRRGRKSAYSPLKNTKHSKRRNNKKTEGSLKKKVMPQIDDNMSTTTLTNKNKGDGNKTDNQSSEINDYGSPDLKQDKPNFSIEISIEDPSNKTKSIEPNVLSTVNLPTSVDIAVDTIPVKVVYDKEVEANVAVAANDHTTQKTKKEVINESPIKDNVVLAENRIENDNSISTIDLKLKNKAHEGYTRWPKPTLLKTTERNNPEIVTNISKVNTTTSFPLKEEKIYFRVNKLTSEIKDKITGKFKNEFNKIKNDTGKMQFIAAALQETLSITKNPIANSKNSSLTNHSIALNDNNKALRSQNEKSDLNNQENLNPKKELSSTKNKITAPLHEVTGDEEDTIKKFHNNRDEDIDENVESIINETNKMRFNENALRQIMENKETFDVSKEDNISLSTQSPASLNSDVPLRSDSVNQSRRSNDQDTNPVNASNNEAEKSTNNETENKLPNQYLASVNSTNIGPTFKNENIGDSTSNMQSTTDISHSETKKIDEVPVHDTIESRLEINTETATALSIAASKSETNNEFEYNNKTLANHQKDTLKDTKIELSHSTKTAVTRISNVTTETTEDHETSPGIPINLNISKSQEAKSTYGESKTEVQNTKGQINENDPIILKAISEGNKPKTLVTSKELEVTSSPFENITSTVYENNTTKQPKTKLQSGTNETDPGTTEKLESTSNASPSMLTYPSSTVSKNATEKLDATPTEEVTLSSVSDASVTEAMSDKIEVAKQLLRVRGDKDALLDLLYNPDNGNAIRLPYPAETETGKLLEVLKIPASQMEFVEKKHGQLKQKGSYLLELGKKKSLINQEAPFLVPVYSYEPIEAYFNPENRLGPNMKGNNVLERESSFFGANHNLRDGEENIELENRNQEQPHFAPVYNYAPENAYYNPDNRYGPNEENEALEKDNSYFLSEERTLREGDRTELNNAFESRLKRDYSKEHYEKSKRQKHIKSIHTDPEMSNNDKAFLNDIDVDYVVERIANEKTGEPRTAIDDTGDLYGKISKILSLKRFQDQNKLYEKDFKKYSQKYNFLKQTPTEDKYEKLSKYPKFWENGGHRIIKIRPENLEENLDHLLSPTRQYTDKQYGDSHGKSSDLNERANEFRVNSDPFGQSDDSQTIYSSVLNDRKFRDIKFIKETLMDNRIFQLPVAEPGRQDSRYDGKANLANFKGSFKNRLMSKDATEINHRTNSDEIQREISKADGTNFFGDYAKWFNKKNSYRNQLHLQKHPRNLFKDRNTIVKKKLANIADDNKLLDFPRKRPSKMKLRQHESNLTKEDVSLILSMSEAYDIIPMLDKLQLTGQKVAGNENNEPRETIKASERSTGAEHESDEHKNFVPETNIRGVEKIRPKDEFMEKMVENLRDMVNKNNKGLAAYDWLSTAVNIQSTLSKLSLLLDQIQQGDRVNPADLELLKYTLFLHKSSKMLLKKSNNIRSNRPRIKKKRVFKIPINRGTDEGQLTKHNARNTEGTNDEKELGDLNSFLRDIHRGLDDLHLALKHISLISTYKSRDWYRHLKDLYLNRPTREKLLEIILHLTFDRVAGLIEDSALNGLEDDFVKYVRRHPKEISRTQDEFVFLLKVLQELDTHR